MAWFRRGDEVKRELHDHLQLEIDDLIARGRSPERARIEALRTMGNLTLALEDVHNLSPWTWWEHAAHDARYAFRTFVRTPTFAITAVLVLALGLGVNGAMFSVIDALVIRPLPVADPQQLVIVHDAVNGNFSYVDYRAIRDVDALSSVTASSSLQRMPVIWQSESDMASVRVVSANYFEGLGVTGGIGRLMGGADDTAPVAVISDGYWTSRFGRAQDVVGHVVTVNGVPLSIVGVAPPRFFGETPGESPDLWVSLAAQRPALLSDRGFTWLNLIGRLKPGAGREQARSAIIARLSAGGTPAYDGSKRIAVDDGAEGLSRWRDRVEAPLWILSGVAGLVLAIACANLATLLLMRGVARRDEIALRMAIGASRSRVFRQLLTESLLLALCAGVVSVPLSAWGAQILVYMAANVGSAVPLVLATSVNARLLVFAASLSMLVGVVVAIVPALREVRRAARGPIPTSSRVVAPERVWGVRGLSIAAQTALCFVLVVGSLMFVRTLTNLESQDLGFQPEGLVRIEIQTARGHRLDAPVLSQLLERIASVPGIQTVAAVAGGTLANLGGVTGLHVDGFTPQTPADQNARADWVGADYFRTAGIRIAAGRAFAAHDGADAIPVAVMNETAARFYFGSAPDAVGRRFVFNQTAYRIVGVSADVKSSSLREPSPRMVYFALGQQSVEANAVEIRTTAAQTPTVMPSIRAIVRDVDPELWVGQVMPASERIDRMLGREHLLANLCSIFGVLTLLVVGVGVYGTLAYAVCRRRKEIGIRIAIGATRPGVCALLLREVAGVVSAGALAGLALSLFFGRFIGSLLFGLAPTDGRVLIAALALLFGVALAAGIVPAYRASRLDPVEALRE